MRENLTFSPPQVELQTTQLTEFSNSTFNKIEFYNQANIHEPITHILISLITNLRII